MKVNGKAQNELEDALYNVLGVLHAYDSAEAFGLTKDEYESLWDITRDYINTINKDLDFAPYEGEPYNFGSY